jgi:bacillithiol system protein YtxJ
MARINWTSITDETQWNTALALSEHQAVVVFKHSTRCSVSSMALRMFERDWNLDESQVKPFFLDLIAHRQISNLIAQQTRVEHESPQLIVLKGGKALYSASHQDISAQNVKNIVE